MVSGRGRLPIPWVLAVSGVLVAGWWALAVGEEAPRGLKLVRLDHPPATEAERALPLVLWPQTGMTTNQEPWASWWLRVDLKQPGLEVVTLSADDPDGQGPAEAVLVDPLALAGQSGIVAAVNANAFGHLPGPDGKVASGRWRAGEAVDIAGLAVSAGSVRSLPSAQKGGLLAFWIDLAGQAHMGAFTGSVAAVREGCNGFWIDLVADGKVLPRPSGDRHPRTALGLDATGRWLLMAVVDGRQPRHSVGMTAEECAALMLRHGSWRAINLDGGGSSVMVAADAQGALQVLNHPSDGHPRPLPIMLGVRVRDPGNGDASTGAGRHP